jgi:hypothetical protein
MRKTTTEQRNVDLDENSNTGAEAALITRCC